MRRRCPIENGNSIRVPITGVPRDEEQTGDDIASIKRDDGSGGTINDKNSYSQHIFVEDMILSLGIVFRSQILWCIFLVIGLKRYCSTPFR